MSSERVRDGGAGDEASIDNASANETSGAKPTHHETRPPERKRMRPEDRRNAVLDAALRVFADAGFRRASLSEVSDEAGVTKGCLYHYFDSKGELLLALMRERSQRAAEHPLAKGAAGSRNEVLQMMVRSLWRRYEKEGQLELTTVALTELPHAPEIARTFFEEVVTPNRAFFRDTLQRAEEPQRTVPLDTSSQTNARPPAAASDELIAMLVPYMVMGAALGYRLYRDIDPAMRTPEEMEGALLDILLNGLAEISV